MKVSKRDISILLIALGLIGAFAVFQFYFRGALKNKKTIDEENTRLEKRLADLQGVDPDQKVAEMNTRKTEVDEAIKEYKSYYLYEDLIMYLYDKQELPYNEVYTEMYNFPMYTLTETQYIDTITGVGGWEGRENGHETQVSYAFGKATIDATYKTNNYKAFKDIINRIYTDREPKAIQSVTALMEKDTGYVGGSIVIDFYNVLGSEIKHTDVVIPSPETGVPNIFGPTYTPTPSPTPTVNPNRKFNND